MTGGRVAAWTTRLRSRLEGLASPASAEWRGVFEELEQIETTVGLLEDVARDSFGAFEQGVRDLSLLRGVHELVVESSDEERLCRGFLEILDREMPCHASALDLEHGTRRRVVHGAWNEAADAALVDAGRNCAREMGLLDLPNPLDHPELAPLAKAAGRGSALICPVEAMGRSFAVLHRLDVEVDHFPGDETRITRALCDLLGLALSHRSLWLHDRSREPLPESRRDSALLSLARSEKFFALDRLAASVAHELNNPMSYVLSNFGRAREYLESIALAAGIASAPLDAAPRPIPDLDALIGDFRSLLDETEEGLERMRTVANRLHDVGSRTTQPAGAVDLNEVVDTALAMARSEAKPSIRFKLALKPLPPVQGRSFDLVHAVFNLLSNAVEAVGCKGEIRASTRRAGPWVRVEVLDDGPSVDEAHPELLFEPFFTTKPEPHGGLGLPIARGIARAHGGDVTLCFEGGSLATLSLPIDQGEEAR